MGVTAGSVAAPGLIGPGVLGSAGHDTVRAILADPRRHGAAELLDAGPVGSRAPTLRLLRSKYKPGRKLTGYYAVPGSDGSVTGHVAVAWTADGLATVLCSPADPAMPQLAGLTEPDRLARLAEALSGPAAPESGPVVTTVRYRPGQRHVLQARYPDGVALYLKTDREASGARAVPAARFLRDLLATAGSDARIAEPVGYARSERAALWWGAPGIRLSAMLDRGPALAAVEQIGRAVRIIHEAPGGSTTQVVRDVRTVEAEASATLRACEHISVLLPGLGATCSHVVAEAMNGLGRLPAERATLTHGDLKADNLLVDAGALTVLDLDRVCHAEPAMDLGKFLADLRWWIPSRPAVETLEAAFRAGYGRCDPVRWARADLVAVLFQVKLAARRCGVHDPWWPAAVRERVLGAVGSLAPGSSR